VRRALVGAAVFLGVLLVLPMVLHSRVFVMVGPSMEPAISHGDLIVAGNPSAVGVGDVVVYYHHRELIAHRVVAVGEDCLVTKGDANPGVDQWLVPRSAVVGKVSAVVPKLGYLLWFARSPPGIALLAGICLLAMLTWNIPEPPKLPRPVPSRPTAALLGLGAGCLALRFALGGWLALGALVAFVCAMVAAVNTIELLKPVRNRYPLWGIALGLLGGAMVLAAQFELPLLLYFHHPSLWLGVGLAVFVLACSALLAYLPGPRATTAVGAALVPAGILAFYATPVVPLLGCVFTIVAGAYAISWNPTNARNPRAREAVEASPPKSGTPNQRGAGGKS